VGSGEGKPLPRKKLKNERMYVDMRDKKPHMLPQDETN